MNEKLKKEFLLDQFEDSSIHAAFARGNVYWKDKDISDEDKDRLKKTIKESLRKLEEEYKKETSVGDVVHIKNIGRLQDNITNAHGNILANNKFRLGTAQKLLNLYLKYLWCVGWIKKPPPHCPFDSGIYEKLKSNDEKSMKGIPSWTNLTEIDDYKKLVANAEKAKLENESIAEWECRIWLKWKQKNSKK